VELKKKLREAVYCKDVQLVVDAITENRVPCDILSTVKEIGVTV
jgi:hypothetical protein